MCELHKAHIVYTLAVLRNRLWVCSFCALFEKRARPEVISNYS
jgi:hypothetical protein